MSSDYRASHMGYFRDFLVKYPDQESRFQTAQLLGHPEDIETGPETNHASDLHVAAHWGESHDTLKQLAFGVYELKELVEENLGEPVIALEQGSVDDILSDDDDLGSTIAFDFGYLVSQDLDHRFQNMRHGFRLGVAAPLLGVGVLLGAYGRTKVVIDLVEEPAVERIKSDVIPAYLGALPLVDSASEYHANKSLRPRAMVVGQVPCRELLHALEAKSHQRGLTDGIIETAA